MAPRLAVVGAGPAGLMAAATAAAAGLAVDVYDAQRSPGRKFLLAGRGGLNLTHAEPHARLRERYGAQAGWLAPALAAFGADAIRAWAADLGIATFTGSSGRVFPAGMKAAPLLRAWLRRLDAAAARLHLRHRWEAREPDGTLVFATPAGRVRTRPDATVLALGGGSWPRLGSDGAWVAPLRAAGVHVESLRPANCGFDCGWSAHFAGRWAGTPVKSVELALAGDAERRHGEFVITSTGVEGGAIYALSARLRDTLAAGGEAIVALDLAPGRSRERLAAALAAPRGKRSRSEHLRRQAGLTGVRAALLRELAPDALGGDADALATLIKALPLRMRAPRPLAEAISSAGGVAHAAVDARWMLRALPGVFCAGEMLDWEAPTGGYLLTACLATGHAAGLGAVDWLRG